jgi:ferredoxin hydrogenase large subunit
MDSFNLYKVRVLEELATLAYENKLTEGFENYIIKKYFSDLKPQVRCCVYKEREITRERINLSMGKTPDGLPVGDNNRLIYVLEAACDGCDVHKVRITDNCKKCLARSCERTCKFDAIYMGNSKAHINYEKCKACGMCVKACSYSAIVQSERPCKRACPNNAVKHIKDTIAVIEDDLCLNCGQCAVACPFGAISEISYITNVVKSIVNGEKVIAIVAPAIQGQFNNTTITQVFEAIKRLGFSDVYEVAIGADMTSKAEAMEVYENIKNGVITTTSCCPAFVNLIKSKYPEIYANNTSTTVSPMVATAQYVKQKYPDAKVVFIGPCMAKKDEARSYKGLIDYVLTFEELMALFSSRKVNPTEIVITPAQAEASIYGRNYCFSGGVSGSLKQYFKENNIDIDVKIVNANGSAECKEQLEAIKNGKFTGNVLEGMMCLGGCAGGVCALSNNLNVLKLKNQRENAPIANSTITESNNKIDYTNINMHNHKETHQKA